MPGATKLLTAGGGAVIVQPASSIASDVTLQLPVVAQTLIGNKTPGTVLQVVQTVLTTEVTISGTTYQTISGLTANITPTSASNKILVSISMQAGAAVTNTYAACKVQRNGSDVSGAISTVGGTPVNASWSPLPSLGGSIPAEYDLYNSSFVYLDSPSSTSAQTYSIVLSPMRTASRTVYINRSGDTGDNNRRNGVSTITLMEIAA